MIGPVAVFLVPNWGMKPEPIFVNIYGAKESSPPAYASWRNRFRQHTYPGGIDSASLRILEESIPPAYVSWRADMKKRVVAPARQAGNGFLGSLKGLQLRARLCIVGLSYRPAMPVYKDWRAGTTTRRHCGLLPPVRD
jgi:hypothetical protein